MFLEHIWKTSSQGMWIYYSVLPGQELCGVGATMSATDNYMVQIGFQFWTPKKFDYHRGAPRISEAIIRQIEKENKLKV